MGLSKTTLRQATTHRDPTEQKQEILGKLAKLYLDDAENNRDGGHSDSDQTSGLRTGVG
jgi:hypothetical protein